MNTLKHLWLTAAQLLKQIWLLPRTAVGVVEQRRLRAARNEHEIEFLDRIRNPSKYQGR